MDLFTPFIDSDSQSIPEAKRKCYRSGTTLRVLRSANSSSNSSWFWQLRIRLALNTKIEAERIGKISSVS